MKGNQTIVRPVELGLCIGCRFAVYCHHDNANGSAYVVCTRKDCDNNATAPLAPLPETIAIYRRPTRRERLAYLLKSLFYGDPQLDR